MKHRAFALFATLALLMLAGVLALSWRGGAGMSPVSGWRDRGLI